MFWKHLNTEFPHETTSLEKIMVDISDGYIELKISKDEIPKATKYLKSWKSLIFITSLKKQSKRVGNVWQTSSQDLCLNVFRKSNTEWLVRYHSWTYSQKVKQARSS